jgi:hypothetical protein
MHGIVRDRVPLRHADLNLIALIDVSGDYTSV